MRLWLLLPCRERHIDSLSSWEFYMRKVPCLSSPYKIFLWPGRLMQNYTCFYPMDLGSALWILLSQSYIKLYFSISVTSFRVGFVSLPLLLVFLTCPLQYIMQRLHIIFFVECDHTILRLYSFFDLSPLNFSSI